MSLITVHSPAIKIYKAYISEQEDKQTGVVNTIVSLVVFFSIMVVLAPVISLPFILAPKAAVRGYAKALISTLD